MSRQSAVKNGVARAKAPPVSEESSRARALELLHAGGAALLWGLVSGSLLVAGLTLFAATVQVLLRRREHPGSRFTTLLAPHWIGIVWVMIDRVWARHGIGAWGRF